MNRVRGNATKKKEKKKKISKIEEDPRNKPHFSGLWGEIRAQRKTKEKA